MAYDEGLAERLRDAFTTRTDVIEKKMFGGIAFMVSGHMCCGVTGDDLMVRVGPEQHEDALLLPHARPMDFTGRAMKGMVYVEPNGLDSDENLQAWVNRALSFVTTLAPK